METILDGVMILNDGTTTNSLISPLMGMGGFVFAAGVVSLIWCIKEWESVFLPIIFTAVGASSIIAGIVMYNIMPYSVDLYVATNDVAVEEIVSFFDITDLERIDDDTLTCHIKPKPEYYDEFLVLIGKE